MSDAATTVVVLGATGMLGHAMVRVFGQREEFSVVAAARSADPSLFSDLDGVRLLVGIDAESPDSLAAIFASARPNVVINCVGLIKQAADSRSVLAAVPLNTLLPHRLAELCRIGGARLIHVSTDCVFSGSKGNYIEADQPDVSDVYGLSKYLGEVRESHSITLRTSIIGHELRGRYSLLEWFLAQTRSVKGFRRAVFSGLPTVELARIVRDHVVPHPDLSGLYHVSAAPISKHDLLTLVAEQYGKDIEIVPDDELVINRSLNSDRFRGAVGYTPPSWPVLIAEMHQFS